MAGRLRDTLSRRYRNRRPPHEQTHSALARGPPVRAGSLASLEVRRDASRSVAVRSHTKFRCKPLLMVEMTSTTTARPLAVAKARVEPVADTDTVWARLVFSYLAWATAWLVFGTLVGEYPRDQVRDSRY